MWGTFQFMWNGVLTQVLSDFIGIFSGKSL